MEQCPWWCFEQVLVDVTIPCALHGGHGHAFIAMSAISQGPFMRHQHSQAIMSGVNQTTAGHFQASSISKEQQ
jgi:hypothetical protein